MDEYLPLTEQQSRALIHFVKETCWMARRYATMRATYAPYSFNLCIDQLKQVGLGDLLHGDAEDDRVHPGGQYAWDGMFGAWNPATRGFEKNEAWKAHVALSYRPQRPEMGSVRFADEALQTVVRAIADPMTSREEVLAIARNLRQMFREGYPEEAEGKE